MTTLSTILQLIEANVFATEELRRDVKVHCIKKMVEADAETAALLLGSFTSSWKPAHAWVVYQVVEASADSEEFVKYCLAFYIAAFAGDMEYAGFEHAKVLGWRQSKLMDWCLQIQSEVVRGKLAH